MIKQASLALIFLAFVFGGALQAHSTGAKPTIEWVKQLGTSDFDWSYGVSSDGLGNVYTTGITYGDLQGPNAGERDVFLTKYNAIGSLLWTRQFGTSSFDIGNAVSADGLGNIYVSGVTGGNLGGPLVGYGDAFISKFDAGGVLLWTRQLGTTQWETSYGMVVDGLGNIYISGYTWGSLEGANAGDGDAFLSKYDDGGTLLWTRQPGSNVYDISNDVTVDSAGNVYIAGVIGDFAGGDNGDKDAFVSKYDANGTLLWSKQFGTVRHDEITGVSSDELGHMYVTGRTDGDLAGTNAGQVDVFIRKYDASGDVLWTQQFGSERYDLSRGISADAQGNTYITGITAGGLGGGPARNSDVFVAKYDSSGARLWIEQFGTANWDEGFSVSVDGPRCVYISGNTRGSFEGSNAGEIDVILARLQDPVPEPCALLMSLAAIALLMMRSRQLFCERVSMFNYLR